MGDGTGREGESDKKKKIQEGGTEWVMILSKNDGGKGDKGRMTEKVRQR